jgi:hypothetical protein
MERLISGFSAHHTVQSAAAPVNAASAVFVVARPAWPRMAGVVVTIRVLSSAAAGPPIFPARRKDHCHFNPEERQHGQTREKEIAPIAAVLAEQMPAFPIHIGVALPSAPRKMQSQMRRQDGRVADAAFRKCRDRFPAVPFRLQGVPVRQWCC